MIVSFKKTGQAPSFDKLAGAANPANIDLREELGRSPEAKRLLRPPGGTQ